MLHVKISQSRYFGVLVFHTLVLFSMIDSCRAHSKVIGPSKPILAIVGENITLPCYLDPVMDAFGVTLEWVRPDLTPRFVLVWRDGVELESKKHGSYEGRTSLFSDELKHGNISLKLSKVKISDEGRYRCFIPELATDTTVQLVVGAVSSPGIQKSKNSSSVVLQCESEGWYPEPEVFWLDGEGNLLSAGPTETVRGPDDLYTVSSRVTVEKRHSNSFTCRVQQKDINQTRETHIQVTDDFFPGRSDSSSSSSARTIISLVASMFILAALFVVVWKWRHIKMRNKKRHEDEETPKAQSLLEKEKHGEQLTAERETMTDLDKEKEKLMRKLKTKDREQEEFEKRVSRLEGLMKEKEKQMQQLKEQLEEVERQRGEAERKLQSVNREEDKMDLKTQREAAGKDEAARLLLDTKNDLERKKAELQEQLQKMETLLERQKREEIVMRQRKLKAANEKEEIIKKQGNENLQERKTDRHREDTYNNIQEAADDEDLGEETREQAERQQEEKPQRGQEEIREPSSTQSPEKVENQSDPVESLIDELLLKMKLC